SGTDWYAAAGILERLRSQGTSVASIAQIPYFANLFPSNLAALINANYCGFTCIPTTVNGQPTTQTQAVYLAAVGASLAFGHDWYANSDFDIRHLINANAIWEVPFGRGRHFFSSANKWADAAIGGWRMTGIFRWNSGLPISTPFDDVRWATNWNAQSNAVRIK